MFVNIGVINSCYGVVMTPAERMVSLVLASNSIDGECKSSLDLVALAGMSKNTYNKALNNLVSRGILRSTKRGWYSITLSPVIKDWLNLGYFKTLMESGLKYKEKLVAVTIAKHIAKGKDYCWPKVETIANLIGTSVRSIRRALVKLIDSGLLTRFKKAGRWFFQFKNGIPDEHKTTNSVANMTDPVPNMAYSKKIEKYKKTKKKGGDAPVPESTLAEGSTKTGRTSSSMSNKNNKPKKDYRKPRKERGGKVATIKKEVESKPVVYKLCAGGLAHCWKTELPKAIDLDVMAIPLTNAKVGMLGHFLKVSKDYDVDARKVIIDVVWNWHKYTNSVMVKADLHSVPDKPMVEFVLKYADMIHISFFEFKKEIADNKEKNSMQLIATKQSVAKKKAEHEVTAEELMDKFSDDMEGWV